MRESHPSETIASIGDADRSDGGLSRGLADRALVAAIRQLVTEKHESEGFAECYVSGTTWLAEVRISESPLDRVRVTGVRARIASEIETSFGRFLARAVRISKLRDSLHAAGARHDVARIEARWERGDRPGALFLSVHVEPGALVTAPPPSITIEPPDRRTGRGREPDDA